jgi:hypothetical protein
MEVRSGEVVDGTRCIVVVAGFEITQYDRLEVRVVML